MNTSKDIRDLANSTLRDLGKFRVDEVLADLRENELVRAIAKYLGYPKQHYKWSREQCKTIKAIYDVARAKRDA